MKILLTGEAPFKNGAFGNQSNTERAAKLWVEGPWVWKTILSVWVKSAGSIRSKFWARIRWV